MMDRVSKLLEQMVGAIEKGRPEIALTLASAMEDADQHANLSHAMGVACAMTGDLETALLHLNRACSLQPNEMQ